MDYHSMMTRLCFYLLAVFVISPLCSPLRARSDDGAEKLILATYKLANEASTATGVVVCSESDSDSRCFVVTANHVLAQMKGDSCTLVSRKRRDDGTFERREIRIPIRAEGNPLWRKHADHDLAALPLPKSIDVNAIPLDCLATEPTLASVNVGDAVWLAVFPERSEANNAGFPILRSGTLASYPITPVKPHPILLVDTTSWTGDSGGPVAHKSLRTLNGDPVVVGIVRGMRNITETLRESRFVERKLNYPLGITEVLQASFARDLLEQILAGE
jgi:hypothetical protein